MGNKLRVGNLADSVTYDELRALFGQAGQVVTVSIVNDHSKAQEPVNSAIVDMIDDAAARRAIDQINGKTLGGRKITVSAEPDVNRYTSPGVRDDQGEKPTRP